MAKDTLVLKQARAAIERACSTVQDVAKCYVRTNGVTLDTDHSACDQLLEWTKDQPEADSIRTVQSLLKRGVVSNDLFKLMIVGANLQIKSA
jgi:hypothetical protein